MTRAIVALVLSILLAYTAGAAAIYVQTMSDGVISSERQRTIRDSVTPDTQEPDANFTDPFGGGATPVDGVAKTRDELNATKTQIFNGLLLWLFYGMLVAAASAAVFLTITLTRSRSARLPDDFRAAGGAWRLLAVGVLALLALHSAILLGVREASVLMDGGALALDIVLLFIVASAGFYLASVFGSPTKMLPSVPFATRLAGRGGAR